MTARSVTVVEHPAKALLRDVVALEREIAADVAALVRADVRMDRARQYRNAIDDRIATARRRLNATTAALDTIVKRDEIYPEAIAQMRATLEASAA